MLALDLPERINLTCRIRRRRTKGQAGRRGEQGIWRAVVNHVETTSLHRGPWSVCRATRGECAELSLATYHRGGAVPGRRSERCRGAHRDRGDGKNPRAIDGRRERRRGRWHDRQDRK